jgi:hypothetical protein
MTSIILPGSCNRFSPPQVAALVVGAVAGLFEARYRRFAELRVTRAVIAALVLRSLREKTASGGMTSRFIQWLTST